MLQHFPVKLLGMIVFVVLSTYGVHAQTYLFDRIRLFNTTNNTTVEVGKPATITSTQELRMPTTVGNPGELLSIVSISGSVVTLGWVAEAVGTLPPSDRLTASQDAAEPVGLAVSVAANRRYSFSGLLLVNKKNEATSSPADSIVIVASGPTGTQMLDLVIRCANCPANTTNASQFSENLSGQASVTSLVVNPAGATTDYSQMAFMIEGNIYAGATSGRLTITAREAAAANDNNVQIGAQSHILVTEVSK